MTVDIDFFFFYGSTYTYLSVMRIDDMARAAGVRVRWRPFNVRAIMVEQNNIPFRDKPVKSAYMWRDIERRTARHALPFTAPPQYPVDPDNLATRVGIVAADEGWCPQYTKATYRAWFLDNKPPGDLENLTGILRDLGKEPDEIIAHANAEAARDRLDAETEAARTLGIFGSPTFAVGDEIFWGDDRLEDAFWWLSTRS